MLMSGVGCEIATTKLLTDLLEAADKEYGGKLSKMKRMESRLAWADHEAKKLHDLLSKCNKYRAVERLASESFELST